MGERTKRAPRVDELGRAFAGSQLQIQLYVNRRRAELDAAITSACDLSLDPLEWVSPIEGDSFKEFNDQAFLRALRLGHLERELREFWPSSGPRWDGLARSSPSHRPVMFLIEAKNYPREVRGGGCKAGDKNDARKRISAALCLAGAALGVSDTERWLGPLYQYANRLAHAAFLRDHGIETFMINVCFFGDPHRSRNTSEQEWRAAALSLKEELGIHETTPSWLRDVFLPVLPQAELFGRAI